MSPLTRTEVLILAFLQVNLNFEWRQKKFFIKNKVFWKRKIHLCLNCESLITQSIRKNICQLYIFLTHCCVWQNINIWRNAYRFVRNAVWCRITRKLTKLLSMGKLFIKMLKSKYIPDRPEIIMILSFFLSNNGRKSFKIVYIQNSYVF